MNKCFTNNDNAYSKNTVQFPGNRQGTLLSIYLGPMRAVEISRYKRTGVPMTIIGEQKKKPADSLALPILINRKKWNNARLK